MSGFDEFIIGSENKSPFWDDAEITPTNAFPFFRQFFETNRTETEKSPAPRSGTGLFSFLPFASFFSDLSNLKYDVIFGIIGLTFIVIGGLQLTKK